MQDQSSISEAEARGFVPAGRCPEAESGINQMTSFRNYEGRMNAAPLENYAAISCLEG